MTDKEIEPLSPTLEAFLAPARAVVEASQESKSRVLTSLERALTPMPLAPTDPPFSIRGRGSIRALSIAMLGGVLLGSVVTAILMSLGDPRAAEPVETPRASQGGEAESPPFTVFFRTSKTKWRHETRWWKRLSTSRNRLEDDGGSPRLLFFASDAADADTLRDERRIIDAARTASVRGYPERALVDLDRHQQQFPEGQLAEERESLRVQTLMALGRHGEARAAAEAFRRRWPQSLFSATVAATLDPSP